MNINLKQFKKEAFKRFYLRVEFTYSPKFWAILPAFNINIGSNSLEFEWLCFAMYLDFTQPQFD